MARIVGILGNVLMALRRYGYLGLELMRRVSMDWRSKNEVESCKSLIRLDYEPHVVAMKTFYERYLESVENNEDSFKIGSDFMNRFSSHEV